MSSSSPLFAARSEDGTLVAVAIPSATRLTIQIYQVETGHLRTTLTTGKAKTATRVVFGGNHHVIAQANTNSNNSATHIVVWNLARGGVVAHDLAAEAGKRFFDVQCHDQHMYVLVGINNNASKSSRRSSASGIGTYEDDDDDDNAGSPMKLQIHQYEPTSGRLVRKIKCGKTDDTAELGLAVYTDQNKLKFLVRNGSSKEAFRILDGETGSKLAKHKYRDSSKKQPHVKRTAGGNGIRICRHIVAIPRLASVALFHLKRNTWMDPIPVTSGAAASDDSAQAVHLWRNHDDSQAVMLLVGQHLYRCGSAANGDETSATLVQRIQSQHNLALLPRSETLIAVLHKPRAGTQSSLQVQSVNYKTKPSSSSSKDLTIEWRVPSDDAMEVDQQEGGEQGASSPRSKRPNGSLTVLGPGQAGVESSNVSEGVVSTTKKRKKLSEYDNGEDTHEKNGKAADSSFGMSVADRLKQLTQAMDDDDEVDDQEDFSRLATGGRVVTHKENFSQKATTESLSELLTQALQGGSDDLLELGLSVQDRNVLNETIEGLDDHCINVLMTKLTTRMASKPSRAEELVVWLSAVLGSGRIQHRSQLLPLKNLVQERVNTFPQILQLEGRLSALKGLNK